MYNRIFGMFFSDNSRREDIVLCSNGICFWRKFSEFHSAGETSVAKTSLICLVSESWFRNPRLKCNVLGG